jgi:hypothetical protein
MSDEVWKERACCGIPKNVRWQYLMFAKSRLFDLTIPELEQSRAAVLNTLSSAQSHRGHRYAIERFIESFCGILTLSESSAQIWAPDS